MKMLKRLFRFSRKPREVRGKTQPATDEFTRLLTSRQPGDLKILAQKLSGPASVKI